MGRSRDKISAWIPTIRSVQHSGVDCQRSIESSQRPRARRSPLVCLCLRSQRDNSPDSIPQADLESESSLWLSEHHVSCRRPNNSFSYWEKLGRLCARANLYASRYEVD